MAEQDRFDRGEFIRFWERRDKASKGGLFLISYLAGMGILSIPIMYFEKHPVIAIAWFPVFFGYLILFPYTWMRIFAGKANKHFLRCPRCRRLNTDRNTNRMIIVATGRCGFCGEEVFTQSPETNNGV